MVIISNHLTMVYDLRIWIRCILFRHPLIPYLLYLSYHRFLLSNCFSQIQYPFHQQTRDHGFKLYIQRKHMEWHRNHIQHNLVLILMYNQLVQRQRLSNQIYMVVILHKYIILVCWSYLVHNPLIKLLQFNQSIIYNHL